MPWAVKRDSRCPVSRPFGVVLEADGSLEGCYASREDAQGQRTALYAGESTKGLGFVPGALKVFNPDQPRWPKGTPRAGKWRPKLGTGAGRVAPGHLERDIGNLNSLIGDVTRYGPRISERDAKAVGQEVEKVALRYSTRKSYEKRLADVHIEQTALRDANWAAYETAWRAERDPEKAMAMNVNDFFSQKTRNRLQALSDEQVRLVRERDRADRDAMLGVLNRIRPMGGKLNHTDNKNIVDPASDIGRVYASEHSAEPLSAMNADLNRNLAEILKVVPKAWLDDTNSKGEVNFEFSTERAFANTQEAEGAIAKGQITGKQQAAIDHAVVNGGSYEGMYDGRYPVVRRPGTEEGGLGPNAAIYDWIDATGSTKNLQYEPSAPPGGYNKAKWNRKAPKPQVAETRYNTTIRIDPRATNENTLLHELSHRVEVVYGKQGISGYHPLAQVTAGFLGERTAGETPQKLQDLYPGYAYNEHELARPDKFIDAYIGKLYPGETTEALTMGMEMLWFPRYGERDINKDPEYRQLILGMMAAI